MKTYLIYKNKLEGLDDVYRTVKTVEKVAASAIHFLKTEIQILQLYTGELKDLLIRLAWFYEVERHPFLFFGKKGNGRKMLVVLTGEKGLVGGLWHTTVNLVLEKISPYQSLVVIGSKGTRFLSEEKIKIAKAFPLPDGARQEFLKQVNSFVMDEFTKELVTQVDIIYPQFVSVVEQKPTLVSYLPFNLALGSRMSSLDKKASQELGWPIFEPSKKVICQSLLEKYMVTFLYKLLLETRLSELAAQTVAMEHAAVKTQNLKKQLKLAYFKERRRFITQKQLESFSIHKII